MNLWENEKLDQPEFDFLDLDFEGTPVIFKVNSWDVEEYTFNNENGIPFTSKFIWTDKGLLRVDSIRLQKQLKPFAIANEKKELVIQRWREGKDNRSTVYQVELHKGVTSTKRK